MASLPASVGPSPSMLGSSRRFSQRLDEVGNDEEADVWAAIERLPTYDQMRTTILQRERSTRPRPVQLKDVDLDQYLVKQFFKLNNPEEDNEIFMSKVRKRMDDVGIVIPTVEILYEKLKVHGQVRQGSRGLPTIPNTILNFVEMITSFFRISTQKKTDLTILEGLTGILKPGRLTLLLGPPSSGKTTFLLALAGQLESDLKVEGSIKYNGYSLNEFEPRKTAAYISQHDLHTPELTVKETMYYSARFQGVGNRFDVIEELYDKEREQGVHPDPETDFFLKAAVSDDIGYDLMTAYYMKIMGLDICANTIVGDQMQRGISGGQRKRLTTGEMVVGPSRALFMDEISTGLDSSTTYQVVKCVGQAVKFTQSTAIISLLQPAPETYALFDDVILLSGGQIVYNGPLEHVEEFFETCGFKCPPRKAIPDFLQEVTSIKDQEQYWADKSKPYKYVPVVHFVEAYKNFHVWQTMTEDMATAADKGKILSKSLAFNRWSLPQWELFKINLDKEILTFKKNWIIPVFNLVQLAVMSMLASSLFFRTEMHHRNLDDAQHYSGVLFFILTQVLFMGYAEITYTAIRFPVFHKFREVYFFPPWTWALSLFMIKVPFAILESLTALIFTYYIIGLDPSASRFFRLWLLLALANQMGSGLFRMLAGFCRSFVIGSSVGGFFLIVVFMLGGYVIPRQSIRNWWIWGYWTLPLSYVENGVLTNEYLAPRWRTAFPNMHYTLGHQFLLGMDLFDRGYWFWMVCGIMVAYIIAFYVIFAWAITYLGIPGKTPAQVSKEQLATRRAQITGEGVENVGKRKTIPRSISSSLKSGLPGISEIEISPEISPATSEHGQDPSTSSRSLKHNDPSKSNGNSSSGSERAMSKKGGMILPFQPLAISFKDVNYFVNITVGSKDDRVQHNKLQLLDGITGSFRPGVLTALVGVSGAGKSTLMDVLAGRKTKGQVEGDIRISGFPKKQETFARIAGYCEQNDIHSPQITVHESLIFSAWLRLPREIDSNKKMEFVQEVMDLVELTPLKDAIVGSPGESGLSTEQRKRVTIAVELVANPSIVFMDEPTSGLDAQAAATVMRAVRNTVDTGRTVVCTIHQPSIDIFDSFDELFLLKRGGRTIYAGPLGKHARKLIEYFEGIEGVPKIQQGVNPAAWVLESTTQGMEERLKVDFADLYKNSSVYEQTKAMVEELSKPVPGTSELSFPSQYAQPMWRQFTCCIWRQFLAYWRTPSYNLMRILLNVGIALFTGTLFWGMGRKLSTQAHVYSLLGAIYSSQMFIGVLTSSAVQPLIASERLVLYRERSAGMYSDFPYAIAQCMVEVPYVLTSTSLYCLITFAMLKLRWRVKKFFWYLFFFFCSQLTFVYLGMMTIAITPSPQLAAIIANVSYNVWNLFSGFFLPHPQFPQWWRWIYWCDPIAYHIYGVIVSQLGDLDDIYATTTGGIQYSVRQLLRTRYGFKHHFLWFIGSMSILFPVVFALMFVLSVKLLNYQQR